LRRNLPAAAACNLSGDISNVPSFTEPTFPAASKAFNAASPERQHLK
jgi:hypothetical protein